jgi:hypothetical protein
VGEPLKRNVGCLSMTVVRIAIVLSVLGLGSNVVAHGKYKYLGRWNGEYPTYNKTKQKFFDLSEVREPLRKLLPQRLFFLLTRGHTREGPIKVVRNYLRALVCGSPDSYGCDNQTMFVMNLDDGTMYVAFNFYDRKRVRYFATQGKFQDLPFDVRDEH